MISKINRIRISQHFWLSEFECKGKTCCNYAVKIDPELVLTLEMIRDEIVKIKPDVALLITSGYRCPIHNRAVGGIVNSVHTQGRAADIACPGIPLQRLAAIVCSVQEKGQVPFRVGFYLKGNRRILHIDTLNISPSRWGDLWGNDSRPH